MFFCFLLLRAFPSRGWIYQKIITKISKCFGRNIKMEFNLGLKSVIDGGAVEGPDWYILVIIGRLWIKQSCRAGSNSDLLFLSAGLWRSSLSTVVFLECFTLQPSAFFSPQQWNVLLRNVHISTVYNNLFSIVALQFSWLGWKKGKLRQFTTKSTK